MKQLLCVMVLMITASCYGPARLSDSGPYYPIDVITEGVPALDFSLLDTTEHSRSLGEFKGKWVVLIIGSRTSVNYIRSIEPTNIMARKFLGRDVVFITLYTAEAHPILIEDYNSGDFLQRMAEAKKPGYGIVVETGSGQKEITAKKALLPNLITVVDQTPSAIASQYGYNPPEIDNPAYIINPEGEIVNILKKFDARIIHNKLLGLTAPYNASKMYKASSRSK